ncbi:hypothetical protein IMX26_13215 [Clostridium sp. 'deep sea']|uniref:hypothetical protein n=1 Tax=Clostridium sp. 'deep sea' TaxID=2779445 RepID=UPI00189662EF|nr:hypothetical protein [Clostridium sp. 'deep sea']QOR34442.1 hypothetical protein IMX26_13215 [Clostridium sp. 'deep sea']
MMVDTIALREAIQQKLEELHSHVYPKKASANEFPLYVVYNWTSTDSRPSKDYSLDIDVWNKSKDETALETLADNIENALDGTVINNERLSVIFYNSSRLNIPDSEPSISRVRITIDMRVYFK